MKKAKNQNNILSLKEYIITVDADLHKETKNNLTLLQDTFLDYLAYKYQTGQHENGVIRISRAELIRDVGIQNRKKISGTVYKETIRIIESMLDVRFRKIVKYVNKDGSIKETWDSIEPLKTGKDGTSVYVKGRGDEVKLVISERMQQIFEGDESQKTISYKFRDTQRLKRQASRNLYKKCIALYPQNEIEFMRDFTSTDSNGVNIPKDPNDLQVLFRQNSWRTTLNCLRYAAEEINSKMDISISYEFIKSGIKTIGIRVFVDYTDYKIPVNPTYAPSQVTLFDADGTILQEGIQPRNKEEKNETKEEENVVEGDFTEKEKAPFNKKRLQMTLALLNSDYPNAEELFDDFVNSYGQKTLELLWDGGEGIVKINELFKEYLMEK